MYGKVKGRARDQVLIVQVTAVNPGRRAADASGHQGRRHSYTSEKRVQRDLDSVGEVCNHLLGIQGDYFHFGIGEVIGQKSAPGAERVIGVRYGQLYGFYPD